MKAKTLDDLQWLGLALADAREGREILTGINVRERQCEATDGHRLHVAAHLSTNLGLGVHRLNGSNKIPQLGEMIEGTYPNVDAVTPSFDWSPGVLFGQELREARAICKATMAANRELGMAGFFVTVNARDGGVASFEASYLFDALSMWPDMPLQCWFPHPLHPARIQDVRGARVAILMPVRRAIGLAERFGIDRYVTYAREVAA